MDRYFQKAEETVRLSLLGHPLRRLDARSSNCLCCCVDSMVVYLARSGLQGPNAKRPKKCRELYYYSWQDLSSFSFLSNLSLLHHTTFCMIKINNGYHFPYTSKIATFYIGSSVCALQYLCKSIDK